MVVSHFFSFLPGEMMQFDNGWFNHQLVNLGGLWGGFLAGFDSSKETPLDLDL